MRLAWAFRNRRLVALVFAAVQLAPAQAIFDGKTLAGWDGDPAFWRVENGATVGETKPGAMPKQNTFLIWRDSAPADFVLDAEYRLTGGNSGIQYRSAVWHCGDRRLEWSPAPSRSCWARSEAKRT